MTDKGRKGFGRSARDTAAFDRYYYPGTSVLRNKYDLRSEHELAAIERNVVLGRILTRAPIASVHYASFKAIHKFLFDPIYDWAGCERDYTSARGPAPFCLPEFIAPSMEKLFADLARENNLVSLPLQAFAERAAHYANEMNAVHPFIEGNGRTLREFLKDLAGVAGHRLVVARLRKSTWYPAAAHGFASGDSTMLRDCLLRALKPLPRT